MRVERKPPSLTNRVKNDRNGSPVLDAGTPAIAVNARATICTPNTRRQPNDAINWTPSRSFRGTRFLRNPGAGFSGRGSVYPSRSYSSFRTAKTRNHRHLRNRQICSCASKDSDSVGRRSPLRFPPRDRLDFSSTHPCDRTPGRRSPQAVTPDNVRDIARRTRSQGTLLRLAAGHELQVIIDIRRR